MSVREDVLIVERRLCKMLNLEAEDFTVIDMTDIATFLIYRRTPWSGRTVTADDFETGTRAAIAGGTNNDRYASSG